MRRTAASIALLAALSFGSPAQAQNGARRGSVGDNAVNAATQPLSDLNLRKTAIPPLLLRAQARPYDLLDIRDCDAVRAEIAGLERLLGPDADARPESESGVNAALKAGGDVLGSVIPFRGLVRQLSGASEHQARWRSAIYAGVARRSYLKGYGKALNCETAREAALRSAEEVLGIADKP